MKNIFAIALIVISVLVVILTAGWFISRIDFAAKEARNKFVEDYANELKETVLDFEEVSVFEWFLNHKDDVMVLVENKKGDRRLWRLYNPNGFVPRTSPRYKVATIYSTKVIAPKIVELKFLKEEW